METCRIYSSYPLYSHEFESHRRLPYKKIFPHSLFWDVYFDVLFIIFCVLFVCFDFLCVFLLLYCIVFFKHNNEISRRFMSLTRCGCSFVSSSVEPPSQSLAVSVSFLNVRFDRATFPFSIAQISSFELSSA